MTRLRVSRKGGEAREVAQAAMTVWLRVPSWASRVEVRCTGALTALRPPAAGRLLPLRFAPAAESPRGELTLTLGVGVAWEPVSDRREQMRNLLQAPLYGPLVLVALTQGERALPFAAQLEPVPASARAQARARVRVRVRVRALTLTLTLTLTRHRVMAHGRRRAILTVAAEAAEELLGRVRVGVRVGVRARARNRARRYCCGYGYGEGEG